MFVCSLMDFGPFLNQVQMRGFLVVFRGGTNILFGQKNSFILIVWLLSLRRTGSITLVEIDDKCAEKKKRRSRR